MLLLKRPSRPRPWFFCALLLAACAGESDPVANPARLTDSLGVVIRWNCDADGNCGYSRLAETADPPACTRDTAPVWGGTYDVFITLCSACRDENGYTPQDLGCRPIVCETDADCPTPRARALHALIPYVCVGGLCVEDDAWPPEILRYSEVELLCLADRPRTAERLMPDPNRDELAALLRSVCDENFACSTIPAACHQVPFE